MGSIIRRSFFFLALGLTFLPAFHASAAPNARAALPIFIHQASNATIPSDQAALFKFMNPAGSPIAKRIGIGFSGSTVVLKPNESAIANISWFMFIIDDCQAQTVRKVTDFDKPQCVVPNPDETDPDTVLKAILALPEDDCLSPPLADPCAEFESALRYDFGTSVPETRKLLKEEIIQEFTLDGISFSKTYETTQFLNFVLGGGNPENAPSLVCSDELYYSPIFAYFFYGYQISPQTGRCISKSSGVLLPTLEPGDHELLFQTSVGGQPQDFPPVHLIQE